MTTNWCTINSYISGRICNKYIIFIHNIVFNFFANRCKNLLIHMHHFNFFLSFFLSFFVVKSSRKVKVKFERPHCVCTVNRSIQSCSLSKEKPIKRKEPSKENMKGKINKNVFLRDETNINKSLSISITQRSNLCIIC